MKKFFFLLLSLSLCSCSIFKKSCDDPASLAYVAESKAISYYSCQNGALLISDWNKYLSGVGACKAPQPSSALRGPIADTLCPVLVPMVVGAGFNLVIKPEYKCDSSKVGAYANEALTALCERAPF